ncbi:MAG: glycosyltransferase [Bacteroidota bacterium]
MNIHIFAFIIQGVKKKRVIVSVINDLVTDNRVHRTCTTLHTMGFEVLLVGRRLGGSLPLQRSYATHRMRLFFTRGFMFYAFFNVRLFFFLLFRRADMLVSNDLDTLLPNYLAARLKGAELVYDSHELFCEVPELQGSPFKKAFWKRIERFCFPRLRHVITVNPAIAAIYNKEYGVEVGVVRNVPARMPDTPALSRQELGLPGDKKIILLQGGGINIDRGVEEAVQAMRYIDDALFLIIGGGDIVSKLKVMASEPGLAGKVKFIGRLPLEELARYTRLADVGLSIDKDTNSNYRYSLPNKLFDYIHAGVPVLASPLEEIKKVFSEFEVGLMITGHDPRHIAERLMTMLHDEAGQKRWRENCKRAAMKYNWENEERNLINLFSRFV